MVEAAQVAYREGRTTATLALLADAGDAHVPIETRRQALFVHGMVRLDPVSPHHNPDAAASLLAAARALYDDPPIALTSAWHLAEHLRKQAAALKALEEARDAIVAGAASQDARLRTTEHEVRRLEGRIRALQAELEQRDAALKKAAAAVIGTTRSR